MSRTITGLMGYGPLINDLFRRSATFVDKIFKGTKPADLPVGAADPIRVRGQSESCQQIGLTIPPKILARAGKVIR